MSRARRWLTLTPPSCVVVLMGCGIAAKAESDAAETSPAAGEPAAAAGTTAATAAVPNGAAAATEEPKSAAAPAKKAVKAPAAPKVSNAPSSVVALTAPLPVVSDSGLEASSLSQLYEVPALMALEAPVNQDSVVALSPLPTVGSVGATAVVQPAIRKRTLLPVCLHSLVFSGYVVYKPCGARAVCWWREGRTG